MKTLLLNLDFKPLAFISDRKAIRLLLKDKVDVLSLWNGVRYFHSSGFVELPSILRLKNRVVRNFNRMVFSRNAVFKRDLNSCQYCGKECSPNQITIDHIVPKSQGGLNSFENCVAACPTCNERKGSKSLNEVSMKLIKVPEVPKGYLSIPIKMEWHNSWNIFTNNE